MNTTKIDRNLSVMRSEFIEKVKMSEHVLEHGILARKHIDRLNNRMSEGSGKFSEFSAVAVISCESGT